MTKKFSIDKSDIMDMDTYKAVRKEERARMITIKKKRRLAIGPNMTLYFENFDTMLYQIHEMLYAEGGGDEQLTDELEAYNPMIPKGSELTATMMLEFPNPDIRERELARLGHIEDTVQFEIGDSICKASFEDDVERTTPTGKTSAVHFLHFAFTPEQIRDFKEGKTKLSVSANHTNYSHLAIIPEDMRQQLAKDFY